MPVYEYQCAVCQQPFSRFFRSQGAGSGPIRCPGCGAGETQRTLSPFFAHQTLKSKIESIDPRIEREIDHADRGHIDPLKRINLDFDRES